MVVFARADAGLAWLVFSKYNRGRGMIMDTKAPTKTT